MVEFRILGPLEVVTTDGPVELRAKPKAVLARLLVQPNQVVSAERLIDDLWDGEPPASATTTLQTYISQLRKQLGSDVLATRSGGYRVHVEAGALDAARFEELVHATGAADDAGPEWLAEQLREALGLWRGPALVDFVGAQWAQPEATRLEGLRLLATEDHLEARLALGEHARLVPELESLVSAYPLRERLWAQLMLALYRSDRQADALRAYGRLRAHLGEELGIEPSAELARLEQSILLHEPDLDWRPPATVMVPAAREEPAGLPTGVVTFLLTDVVGSTRLWDEHPAAMADALVAHDELLTDAVVTHRGRVLKQRGEGDSTFSVFTRATDALGAALDAQRALAGQVWPIGCELSLRMALHTGEAVERDGDYYGGTVNRAARLRGLAEGGQIVASLTTVELLADHLPESVLLVEQGPRALRGLRRLERVYVVAPAGVPALEANQEEEEGEPPGDVPLPSRLGRLPEEPFVGRAEVLGALDEAWQAAKAGERRVVLVAGEPGIGKTFLAAELAQHVRSDGGVVLYGRCDDGLGVAFQPFTEALRAYVSSCAPGALYAQARESLSELSRLLPELDQLVPGLAPPRQADPETERYELFEAVVSFLAGVTSSRPVLLVVDDLHWAARPTLLLLRHVALAEAAMSLLVVGTYRDTEAQRATVLGQSLPDIRAARGVDQLTLAGLSVDEIDEYLTRTSATSLDRPAFASTLERETRGNPLFVRELVRHLADRSNTSGAPATSLPSNVRDVIERRLARLSPTTMSILTSAAVVGSSFRIGVLEQLVDNHASIDDLLDGLDEALHAGILTEPAGSPDTLEFTHALIRDAIYTTITAGRRSRLHKQIVQTLESFGEVAEDDDRLPALAYHGALAAHLGLATTAADYCLLAGRQALVRLAFEEAIEHLERGLRVVEAHARQDSVRRIELLLALGEVRMATRDTDGVRDAARRAADEARHIGSGELLARAAVLDGGRFVFGRADPITLQLLGDALAAIGHASPVHRTHVLSELSKIESFQGDHVSADRHAREALEIARQTTDLHALWHALDSRVISLQGSPHAEDRLQLANELMAVSRACGDENRYFSALVARSYVLSELGDFSGSNDVYDQLRSRGRIDNPGVRWYYLDISTVDRPVWIAWNRVFHAMLQGRWEEADGLAVEGLRSAGRDPNLLANFGGQLFHRRREQGRIAELLPAIRRGIADNPDAPVFRASLALALADLGERDESRAHFKALALNGCSALHVDFTWIGSIAMLIEVCAFLNDRRGARSLHRLFKPHSGHAVIVANEVACNGAVDRYLGMLESLLGDWDAAEQHYEHALALEQGIESPPLVARTQYWYGSMLVERARDGDRERARGLLQSSAESAERLDMDLLARQARERLIAQ